jgi:hypothetical protein
MTGRATFGDFAATATRHLDQLHRCRPRAPGGSGSAMSGDDLFAGVRSAVHAMAGYADDVAGTLAGLPPEGRGELFPWIWAATHARDALAAADALLRRESVGTTSPAVGMGSIGAAAVSMTLGRDVLHSHLSIRDGMVGHGRSEWAPAVTAAPVACAVLHRVGGWARQVAAGVGRGPVDYRGMSARDRHDLSVACQVLWVVSWRVGSSQERMPSTEHLRLLAAVPVNGLSAARVPTDGEPVSSLCDGTISTAERLRAAARRAAGQAAWSPALTRESLRQTAGCCAITASNLHIVLRTLAGHDSGACVPASAVTAQVAGAVDRARAAWLHVTEAWDVISTDTRGVMNQVAGEAAGLALWTGRLAYANAEWTPAMGPRCEQRPSADLAASRDQLRHVVDAVHHACHTLTAVADAERSQAQTASAIGRLVVPTRSLPDSFDVPYRFAIAPGTRSAPLLCSYDLALQASVEATDAIAEVAADVQAPSQILTIYRALVRTSDSATADDPARDKAIETVSDRGAGPRKQRSPYGTEPVVGTARSGGAHPPRPRRHQSGRPQACGCHRYRRRPAHRFRRGRRSTPSVGPRLEPVSRHG